jgi:hypothetical protein
MPQAAWRIEEFTRLVRLKDDCLNLFATKMRKACVAFQLLALVLLSGCGGRSSSSPVGATYSPLTGVFSDYPVAGLSYRTSSSAVGTTDAQGEFNYAAGDSVAFSVGGLQLGSSVGPSLTLAGIAPLFPVNVAGSSTSDAAVVSIGRLLATLNSIAVAAQIAANQPQAGGVFVMPENATAILHPFLVQSSPISATNLSDQQLAAIASSGAATVPAAASAVIRVPTALNATANMNQGLNAANVLGTVWRGACTTCSGIPPGTFYFQPDGNMTGFTSDGNILAGVWSGNTVVGGGVQFSLVSSNGNYSQSGAIPAGSKTGTAVIYDSNNNNLGTYTFSQAAASTSLTNSLYVGGWSGVYTPTAAGAANDVYGAATPVYAVLAPDGTFSGVMDGNQSTTGSISGTWTTTSGIGTGGFQGNPGTFSFDMASRTGSYSQNGVIYGYISFSRQGTLSMNSPFTTVATHAAFIPLQLNVQISWSANNGGVVSSFPLMLSLYNGSAAPANLISSGIKSEVNPLGNGAAAYTMTDIISVPYPAGSATSYVVSAGQAGCAVANGSGTVVNNQPANLYATVQISCP